MSEYELVDLMRSGVANMFTGQGIYFTQLASYLLVAYLVGDKLTTFQVTFLNFAFVLFTLTGMSGFLALMFSNLELRNRLSEMGSSMIVMDASLSSGAVYSFIYFRCLILIGALILIWQVRHPKTQ
jgi:hypothetical protein